MKDSPVRAALLDFDGTLVHLAVDWERLRGELSTLFAAHGVTITLRPLYGGMAAAFAQLEAEGTPSAVRGRIRRQANRLMTEAEQAGVEATHALPNSRELVEALRACGCKVIIQSSNSVGVIREVLDRLAFPRLDAIVGREGSRFAKPNPAGVRKVLRALGIDGRETAVVGDGDFDVQLGRAIRATTIRIGRGSAGVRADYEVASLHEVIAILVPDRARAAV
jgi:phosphoglycolate phosphatase